MNFFQRIKTQRQDRSKARSIPRLPLKLKPKKPGLINHDQVHKADPYSAEVHSTRVAWYLRLSVMMNVAFGFAVISQTLLLGQMTPLQRTVPVLMTLNPALQTPEVVKALENIRAFPLEEEVPAYDIIMEAFSRRWAQLVFEVDNISQKDRMQRGAALSTDDVWQRVEGEFYDDYEKAINKGVNRSIVIESSNLFSRFKNKKGESVSKYTLVLNFIDAKAGQSQTDLIKFNCDESAGDRKDPRCPKVYKRFLWVDIVSRPEIVPKAQKFENPAGLIVTDFALKKRED